MAQQTKPGSPKETGSVHCPSCGDADTMVKDTRHNGLSRRRRECRKCGAIFKTVEILETEFNSLTATAKLKVDRVSVEEVKNAVLNLERQLSKRSGSGYNP